MVVQICPRLADFLEDDARKQPETELHHLVQTHFHIIAQIVEAVFVVGPVGNVAGIGGAALRIVKAVHDHTDGEVEEFVDPSHPFGVALGEIVVHGDDVNALAGERVEIDRQRRHQRLAFAGFHLGDVALVQHHAADQLHVEMALSEGAPGGFAHGGEGGNQNVVEGLAVREGFSEFGGAGLQRLVGQDLDFRLERVDGIDAGLISLDPPVVGGAEKLAGERADHTEFLSLQCGVAAMMWSTKSSINPRLSTHRDASKRWSQVGVKIPGSSYHEWEFSNPRFDGQKQANHAMARRTVAERYGRPGGLSTPRSCQGFHHFDRFFALPRRHDWASVPPPEKPQSCPGFEDKDFP